MFAVQGRKGNLKVGERLRRQRYDQRHTGGADIHYLSRHRRVTLDFLTRSLIKIAPVILDEAGRLGIPIPEDDFAASDFPGIVTGTSLEYNIDDEQKIQPKKHIVKIASEFLNIGKHFDQYSFFEPFDLARMRAMVPEVINEVEVRRYEMDVLAQR